MNDGLAELEALAGSLLRSLSGSQRRTLLRRMARDLTLRNRTRIMAQREPDGGAFTPRKAKAPAVTGRGATCFLYPSGGGAPRRVIMKSFTWSTGRMMTGFDIEAGAIRSFAFDKVVKWLPVPPEHANRGSNLRRRGGAKRRAMFRRLASGRYLRSQADDRSFWVGFSDKASAVASIHHYGLRDKPNLRAKDADYPRRELIGANDDDREHLLDLLYDHFASSV